MSMIERDLEVSQALSSQSDCFPMRSGSQHPIQDQPLDVVQLKRTVHSCIGEQLCRVEEQLRHILSSKFDSVQALVGSALSMGGKRLRPMLTLLSSQAVTPAPGRPSDRDLQDLVRIATAVELVHTASLAHDDVMDQADNRRHQPTICNLVGNSAAILLGDFLFTKAYAVAASCRSPFIARRIAAASTGLCEGELRQQLSVRNWQLSSKEYYSILIQKTALLCSTSCRLGAWQVGSSQHQQRALENFGRLLGLAFQIYDDWLDYWGDSHTGKTLGTDLEQRKPTLPLMRYLQLTSEAEARRVIQLLSSSDPNDYLQAVAMIRQSDAGALTLRTAHRLARRAISDLHLLPESSARDALESIAVFSVGRVV